MKQAKNPGYEAFGFDVESNPTTPGYSRAKDKYAGNQWSGVQNPNKDFNEGVGPRRGNEDFKPRAGGPSATKDAFRRAPHTSEATGREYPKDIDRMNYGKQFREYSTTTVKKPGNIDRINIEPKGSQGFGSSEKGGSPKTKAGETSFNYGPKSQY